MVETNKLIYIVATLLIACTLSTSVAETNVTDTQNYYHPSRFSDFYKNELNILSGNSPNSAVRAIYTIGSNQSPDIGAFLEKLWKKEQIEGLTINYSLFKNESLKLMLAQTLLQRNIKTKEVLAFVLSTVRLDDINNQYPTIQALRLSNHSKSLAYLREYSIKGNRTTAEHAIPGLVHWVFYGSNKEVARRELETVRNLSPYNNIISKYENGYLQNAANRKSR